MDADEISEIIDAAVAGPSSMTNSAGESVQARPLSELFEAQDRIAASAASSTGGTGNQFFGMRVRKAKPSGTVPSGDA